MTSRIRFALMICLAATNASHAGLLGDLSRAVDAVNKVTGTVPTPAGGNSPSANPSSTGSNGNSAYLQLPLNLDAYPRSQLYRRIDNPWDNVRMPISTPIKTPDGYVPPYSVPMEGKVTMLQFKHRSDDSPLLIQQHYESWLAQNGFERLLVCAAPCNQLPGNWEWQPAIDPGSRLDSNYIPKNATYIAAYRNDAMVFVGIGKFIYDHSSVVKVVEGRVLDPQPWKTVTTPRTPAPRVAPSKPAASLAATSVEPKEGTTAGSPSPEAELAAANGKPDWYGKYGWKWENIPVGTKVRTITKSLGEKKYPPTLYAAPDNANVVKAILPEGEEAVFLGVGPIYWQHVRTSKGEGWMDYRFIEPIFPKNGIKTVSAHTDRRPASSGFEAKGTAAGNGLVDSIEASQLGDYLARNQGLLVVHFSSNDQGCPFCVQSNPRFDTLAKVKAGEARFVRVTWQPYTQAFDDPLAVQYSLTALPTFLAFKDGKIISRVNGNYTAVELGNKLLPEAR